MRTDLNLVGVSRIHSSAASRAVRLIARFRSAVMATTTSFDYVPEQDIPELLRCCRCREILAAAYRGKGCTHAESFCQPCFNKLAIFPSTSGPCSICGGNTSIFELAAANPAIDARLAALKVYCTNRVIACDWIGSRSALGAHLDHCAKSRCSNVTRGCAWTGVRTARAAHLTECPMELQQCPHSLCKQTVLRKDLIGHMRTCAEADRTVRLRHANPAPGDITWIHAGGRELSIGKHYLLREKESLLAALFSGPGHSIVDNVGRSFWLIDRDGDAFALVLEWLRSGLRSHLDPKEHSQLLVEARFWQLSKLEMELMAHSKFAALKQHTTVTAKPAAPLLGTPLYALSSFSVALCMHTSLRAYLVVCRFWSRAPTETQT